MVALFLSFARVPNLNIQQQIGMVSRASENVLVDDMHVGAVRVFDVFTLHPVEVEIRARPRFERRLFRYIVWVYLTHGVIL